MCRPDPESTLKAVLPRGGPDWLLTADDLFWQASQARQALDGPGADDLIRQALQLMPSRLLDPMKANTDA